MNLKTEHPGKGGIKVKSEDIMWPVPLKIKGLCLKLLLTIPHPHQEWCNRMRKH
jgi:hypothetical protein